MIRDYYYEVLENDQDGVKRICTCGSEADARLMMSLAPDGKNRSWVKRNFLPPDTVNTTAKAVDECKLKDQQVLPERQQEPVDLTK